MIVASRVCEYCKSSMYAISKRNDKYIVQCHWCGMVTETNNIVEVRKNEQSRKT